MYLSRSSAIPALSIILMVIVLDYHMIYSNLRRSLDLWRRWDVVLLVRLARFALLISKNFLILLISKDILILLIK